MKRSVNILTSSCVLFSLATSIFSQQDKVREQESVRNQISPRALEKQIDEDEDAGVGKSHKYSKVIAPTGLQIKEIRVTPEVGQSGFALPIIAWDHEVMTPATFSLQIKGRWNGKVPPPRNRIVRVKLLIELEEFNSLTALISNLKRKGLSIHTSAYSKVVEQLKQIKKPRIKRIDKFLVELRFAVPEDLDPKKPYKVPKFETYLDYGHKERAEGRVFRFSIVPDEKNRIRAEPSYSATGFRPAYEKNAIFYRRLIKLAGDIGLFDNSTQKYLTQLVYKWEREQRNDFRNSQLP